MCIMEKITHKHGALYFSILIIMLVTSIFALTSCRNMTETYVYSGEISGVLKLQGTSENIDPLGHSGITINIRNKSQTVTFSITTSISGSFSANTLPDDTYNVVAEKSGYVSISENNFVIINGTKYINVFGNPCGILYKIGPPNPPL